MAVSTRSINRRNVVAVHTGCLFRSHGAAVTWSLALILCLGWSEPVAGQPAQDVLVPSDWSLAPSGLNDGDSFRLLFVTSNTRRASATAITRYDTFVQNDAGSSNAHQGIQSHSTHFKALGSTSAVDARDHTGTTHTAQNPGVPIYWLGGDKVADDYSDFYDGSWDSNAPTDASGTALTSPANVKVFTGSKSDGTKFSRNNALQSRFLGTTGTSVRTGNPGVMGKELNSGVEDKTSRLSLLGLSGVFTLVPGLPKPTLSTATVDRRTLTLGYDQVLDVNSVPASADFAVTVEGNPRTVSDVRVNSSVVTLRLTSAVLPEEVVTISYTPGTNPIRNEAGNADAIAGETVTNNTQPVLSIEDASGFEGDVIEFTVTLSSPISQRVTVNYETEDQTAEKGADYRSTSGILAFEPGETRNTVTVRSVEDTLPEGNETFAVTLSAAQNARLTRNRGLGTIRNDDVAVVNVGSDWGLIPSGLTAGDSFRLLFVTSVTRRATASGITNYDTFVQDTAGGNNGHHAIRAVSDSFQILGSTSAVDARDHTVTMHTPDSPGVPVYWLGGDKVADHYGDFYDGSWDSNVPTDESGTVILAGVEVFTGSTSNGSGFDIRTFGADSVRIGKPGTPGEELDGGGDRPSGESHSFYGLSGIFKIVGVVPPALSTVVVDGATLTLAFNNRLDRFSVPAASAFTVRVGGELRTVWNVRITNKNLILTLETAVRPGDEVTVSYTPGTVQLRNVPIIGQDPVAADRFVNEVARNTTIAPPAGQDIAPLYALFDATGGMNWRNSRNWRSSSPLNTWHGVETDTDGYVTALTLNDNRLRGVVPADLMQLSRLQSLRISSHEACVVADPEVFDWLDSIVFDGAYCPREVSEIGIAFYYTPAARMQAGSTAKMNAYIDSQVAAVNSVYKRNDVGIELVVVRTGEVAYREDATGQTRNGTHLSRLASPTDGHIDTIHGERESNGADLVHLIVFRPEAISRGVANIPSKVSPLLSGRAFSVTTFGASPLLLAHELGHNFGAHHDRHELCGSIHCSIFASNRYGYGYVNQKAFDPGAPKAARWRTIMSYNTQCTQAGLICTRVNLFSNPHVTFRGEPAGVGGDGRQVGFHGAADVVRLLNHARETVSRYTTSTAVSVDTSVDFVPDGILPGDSFRLLFVTSMARDASSSEFADYDNFIRSNVLNGVPELRRYADHFTVLGSIDTGDAIDHTQTTGHGDPIYWVGGVKVADDNSDFYDFNWDNNTPTDESGTLLLNPQQVGVFTGTLPTGRSVGGFELGSAQGKVTFGLPGRSRHELTFGVADSTEQLPLYGLSGPFRVLDDRPIGRTSVPSNPLSIILDRNEILHDAGATDVSVTVQLLFREHSNTDFELQVLDGTARMPEDFAADPGSILMTIPAGYREVTGSFTLTPVPEEEGSLECDKTVIVSARVMTGSRAAFNVSPETLTLKGPGSDSPRCMGPVQRPPITLTPDGPANPPSSLPETDSPEPDTPAVSPSAAMVAIWTDRPGYQFGEPVRLYRSLDPMGDDTRYTIFYSLENRENGRRFFFAPGIGSSELEDSAVDQFGMSQGAFRQRPVEHAERELIWAGSLDPGLWQFVAEIRTSNAKYVVKTVYAKFVVVNDPPRQIGADGLTVDIQANETWFADTIHELRQPVHVRAGATLTIQAGTLIKALGQRAAIVIERGGRIEAEGTRRAPVVMTCDAPVGQRSPGCWGGLTLRGSAPTGDAAIGVARLPAEERDLFGGDDPADSSGSLRFVRVEFAGGETSSHSSRASIALHGVGSETIIDHVQAHASLGDGIEIRGGAARCLHCVSSGARDDGLEWSQGWLGTAQHVFLQQSLSGDRGIEATGPATVLADSRGPTLYNVTLVGGAAIGPSALSADGIALRSGATVTMRNTVLIGSGRFAVSATDSTIAPFVDGRSSLRNAIVHANGGLYGVAQVQETVSPYVQFIDADPQLRNIRYEMNPDPRPTSASPALEPDLAVVPPSDGALSRSQYLGAFGEDNWLEEWTIFGPESDFLIEDPSR